MIIWIKQLPREARVLTLSALASCSVILLWWLVWLGSLTFTAAESISKHEPRIGRLLGYEQAAPDLRQAEAREVAALRGLAFPEAAGESAGAELQQVLRRFAESAGLRVNGSQLVREQQDSDTLEAMPFENLGVELSLVGLPMALDAFLVSIDEHKPRLLATSLELQKPRQRRSRRGDDGIDPQLLNIRLRVDALQEVARL